MSASKVENAVFPSFLRDSVTTVSQAPEVPQQGYEIRVFIAGQPGYFTYEVSTLDQAMDHFGKIVATGYRRPNDRGQLVWYAPSRIEEVRVIGEGLESAYADSFKRT